MRSRPVVVRVHVSGYAHGMRLMGIDFGAKRIGVALSDESGAMAFPHSVVPNGPTAVADILTLAQNEGVGTVVVGLSANFANRENPIMVPARAFAGELARTPGVTVVFEPEFLTSMEAARIQGEHDQSDASAAALILNSYILRRKNAR